MSDRRTGTDRRAGARYGIDRRLSGRLPAFAADVVATSLDAGTLGNFMTGMRGGFAETGVAADASTGGPRHFRPADPNHNPTAGWDPFDPTSGQAAADPTQRLDPLAAVRAEGYASGVEAARQIDMTNANDQSAALDNLTAALARINGFDREALASQLRQTVLFLVTRVIGEAGISPDLLTARVEAAVALLADNAEPALLRLNPEDLPLVEGRLPERVFAIADKGVERGGLLIETKSTAIEDGPSAWLAQLAAAIERTALPGAA